MVFILQYPTNVYPENECIDCTILDDNNKVEFTFNGDYLGVALARFYDYEKSTWVMDRYVMGNLGETIAYNGDTVTFPNGTLDALTNGKDYVMQLLLCQSNDGTKPDMTLLRGTLQRGSATGGTSVYIENNIGNIYEWNVSGDMCYPNEIGDSLITNLMLYVGDEGRSIVSYNRNTGEIVIASALSGSHAIGEKYVIKSNYLTSPLYFFKCRKKPNTTCQLSVNTETDSGGGGMILGLEYSGTYSDPLVGERENFINNYQATLYVNNTLAVDNTKKVLAQTDKIYSQNIHGLFSKVILPYSYITNPLVENKYDGFYYKVALDITSNDGMTVHRESTWLNLYPPNNLENYIEVTTLSVEKKGSYNELWFEIRNEDGSRVESSDICVQCLRRNVKTNEFAWIPIHHANYIRDMMCPNKGEFEYTVIPYDVDTGRPFLDKSKTVSCSMDEGGYYIISLNDLFATYNSVVYLNEYSFWEVWHLIGEIDDTTNTQNNDKYLQVGYGKYTQISSTDVDYMSGQLSAMLGSIHCDTKTFEDDIELVKAWRKFMTHDGIYLLKSQKGDVWLVNVTNTVETQYSEMTREIPTTFTFSWAECESTENKYIRFLGEHTIR